MEDLAGGPMLRPPGIAPMAKEGAGVKSPGRSEVLRVLDPGVRSLRNRGGGAKPKLGPSETGAWSSCLVRLRRDPPARGLV